MEEYQYLPRSQSLSSTVRDQTPLGSQVDYFSNESLHRDLAGRAARGGLVTSGAQLLRLIISLSTVPVLTRLLTPEDFGLVAMVAFFTNFAAMFVDSGLSMATVQREKVTHQQVTNLFWIATTLGGLVAAAVASLSPFISWFYGEPRLLAITLALACSYVLSGMTIQHKALLQRNMQFKAIALTDVASILVGQCVGIAWAWHFFGKANDYFALVCIPLATALTRMVLVWATCSWRPGLPRRGTDTRDLVVFGANLTSFNFINYFARNFGYFVIGWWWGPAILGIYERAYRLLLMPMYQVGPAFSSVVVPALSRLKATPDKYRLGWITAARLLIWATIPLIGLLWCVADSLVLLYLGPKWGEVTPIFRALAPAAWSTTVGATLGWVFFSWGHLNRLVWWGCVNTAGILVTILCSVSYGTLTVAYSVGVAYTLLRIPGCAICFPETPVKARDLVQLIWRPTLLAIVTTAIAYTCNQTFFGDASSLVRLISGTGIYLVCFANLTLLIPGGLSEVRLLQGAAKLLKRRQLAAPTSP